MSCPCPRAPARTRSSVHAPNPPAEFYPFQPLHHFILFSLYTTDLSLLNFGPLGISLPTYHFETLAVAGQFYTYEIREGKAAP
ncbi:DUF4359 domain-containing protein [Thermostichus sp. MS-CIW-26]